MATPFTEQDSAARRNLKDIAQSIVEIPIEEFTREKTLGVQGGFVELRSEIERIRQIAKRIGYGDLDLVPFEHVEQLRSSITVASHALNRARELTIRPGTDVNRERDSITTDIKNAGRQLFIDGAPALAAAFRQEEFSRFMESERARLNNEWQERLDAQVTASQTLKQEAEDIKKEVAETLEAAKAAAADAGISAQSTYFQVQADEHKNAATRWLLASAAVLAAVVAVASWSIGYYLDHAPAIDSPVNIQLLAAKVVLFSALFTGLVATTRSYRAHRHNYVVNKHRQNALATFRAFSQQANADPATKNAVLLQATQCIFSPQVSGYSSQDVDSNFSPILEIVRGVGGDKRA